MPMWVNIMTEILRDVTLVWAVIEVIKSARKDITAPEVKQGERITALEMEVKTIKGFLDNDDKRLKLLESSTKITQQSLLAIMSHLIDGNHTEQLKDARDNLQQYLIYGTEKEDGHVH